MDNAIADLLKDFGIHPAVTAIVPIAISAWPKAQSAYEAWRGKEKTNKANKLFLDHLKLHYEIRALARAANSEASLPDLPPLPPLALNAIPVPVLAWKDRVRWCLAGTFFVLVLFGLALLRLIAVAGSDGAGFVDFCIVAAALLSRHQRT